MDIWAQIIGSLVTLLIGGGMLMQLGGIKSDLKHLLDHIEDHEERLREVEKGQP